MRLAVISPFVDRQHGTERALSELLEGLADEHGCTIYLYSQRVEGLQLRPPQLVPSEDSGSITWRKIPSAGGPHLLQFLVWMFLNTIYRFWDRTVGNLRFDLVLSPGINCLDADFVMVHAIFRRLKELSAQEGSRPPGDGLLSRWHRHAYYGLLAGLERRIYANRAVALATVSERTKKLLTTHFHRQDIVVIPNAVDSREFSPDLRLKHRLAARSRRQLREGEMVLLLIGNDWRAKGLPCVLEAIQAASDKALRLIVVGNENPSRFLAEAKRLGIARRVQFEVSGQDALELYAAADVYVSPSLEDSFGLPVLEAMACGLPVITSPFAGVSELVTHEIDGFVLNKPQDAEELAGVLNRLAADSEIRNRIGAAAAIRAKSCDWHQNSSAVFKRLEDLLARKSFGSG